MRKISLLVLLCFMFGPAVAAAQEKKEDARPIQASQKVTRGPGYSSLAKVSVNLEAGPLSKFVAQVQQQAPNTNIVLSKEAKYSMLPKLRVKNVSLHQLMDLVRRVGKKELRITGNGNLYYIESHTKPQKIKPMLQTEPFAVGDLFRGNEPIKQEHLTNAIQIALEMSEADTERTKMKLHTETGLLFVRGEPSTIRLVDQTIQQLRSGRQMYRVRSQRSSRGK